LGTEMVRLEYGPFGAGIRAGADVRKPRTEGWPWRVAREPAERNIFEEKADVVNYVWVSRFSRAAELFSVHGKRTVCE
jgi:hypothetical protein